MNSLVERLHGRECAHRAKGNEFDANLLKEAREALAALPHPEREERLKEALEKIVRNNGPVCIDFWGEDLAWRPLDYGTWTPLALKDQTR